MCFVCLTCQHKSVSQAKNIQDVFQYFDPVLKLAKIAVDIMI